MAEICDSEVWQVGRHLLACGDIERGDARRFVDFAVSSGWPYPMMMYSDPPWSAGIARTFRKWAGAPDPDLNFGDLMIRVVEAARLVTGDAYVEMGRRTVSAVLDAARACGLAVAGSWSITYASGGPAKPCALVQFGAPKQGPGADGMDDERESIEWAIKRSSLVAEVVFDPCLGLGATSRACWRTGRRCLGMELNPARLARSLAWLEKKEARKAVKVGEL